MLQRFLIIALTLCSLTASAQWQQTGSRVRYVNGLGIPTRDTAAGVAADSSQILIRPADSSLYVKYKRTWLRVGGGGGSIAGSGTTNYVPKFTSSTAIGNSQIFDNGTNVGIGTITPTAKFSIQDNGNTYSTHISGNNFTNGVAIGTDGSNNAVVQGYNRAFTSTNNITLQPIAGNVGIGTTSPAYKLDVNGFANSNFGFRVTDGTIDNRISWASGNIGFFGTVSNHSIAFYTNLNEIMRINSNGRVLIGTTTDNGVDKLQVSGSVRTSSNLQVDGLVGINITPASYSLNINGSGTNVTRIATQQTNNINLYEHSSSTPFGQIGNASGFNASGSTGDMSVGSYNNLSFYTRSGSFIERARITATSGNVLISKTTDNGIDKLQVNGSIDAKGFAQAYTARGSTYTAATSDYLIDCTTGTFTVNLPDALLNVGRILIIKNSGTGTITVDGSGTQTIDGAATYSLSAQWATVQIMCDGNNWKILAKF